MKEDTTINHSCTQGTQTWFSTRDGIPHFLRSWVSFSDSPVLIYLHGIEGHSLWFSDTASYLQAKNITVYAFDRRGSGMSKEQRGHITSWQTLISDAKEITEYICQKHTESPLFLMGNCWGARCAVLLSEQLQELKGLILTCPAFTTQIDVPLQTRLTIIWRWLTGNWHHLPIPLSIHHFTNNPHFLAFIRDDKLRLTEASAKFFVEGQVLSWLAKHATIHTPLLVLQAGHDTIVNIDALQSWFRKIKVHDKTLKVFPDSHHSLDFDKNPQDYQEILVQWILQHK